MVARRLARLLAAASLTAAVASQPAGATKEVDALQLEAKADKLLILLPGFTGSKIRWCRPNCDSQRCSAIWDINIEDTDLRVRKDRKYCFGLFESVTLMGIKFSELYDLITTEIDKLDTNHVNFQPIAYDWRLGVAASTNFITSEICRHAKARRTHLYVLAHSMGGIVFREWLRQSGPLVICPTGNEVRVAKIAFIATPHLGAPIILKALLQGYGSIGPWGLHSSILTRHALDFDSVYALLPVLGKSDCAQIYGITSVREGPFGVRPPLQLASMAAKTHNDRQALARLSHPFLGACPSRQVEACTLHWAGGRQATIVAAEAGWAGAALFLCC